MVHSCLVQKGGQARRLPKFSIDIGEDGYLQLSGTSDDSSFRIEQGVKQRTEEICDDQNANMEICFKYRMKDNGAELHVIWDGKKVNGTIAFSDHWKDKGLRVPAMDVVKHYNIGFLVEGKTSVKIDNVEMSCHTQELFIVEIG